MRCPACLYPLPGFAANFFVPEEGRGAVERATPFTKTMCRGSGTAWRMLLLPCRDTWFCVPRARERPASSYQRGRRAKGHTGLRPGEPSFHAWWSVAGLWRRARDSCTPAVFSRDGPDARSRPAGCGAGAGGAGLRGADGACCGSRRSPCVRDCPAIAAGRGGRKAGRRTKAAGQSRPRRPRWCRWTGEARCLRPPVRRRQERCPKGRGRSADGGSGDT